MANNTQYLEEASKVLGVSQTDLAKIWSHGTDIVTPGMTVFGENSVLDQKTFYISEGLVRQYYVDTKGKEHTIRIIQGPNLMSPAIYEILEANPVTLHLQSLTPLKAHIWDFQFLFEFAQDDPVFFSLMTKSIINGLTKKAQKDYRLNEYNALERYKIFIIEFPGAANLIPLKYIASYLGMTPETLSRIRKEYSNQVQHG